MVNKVTATTTVREPILRILLIEDNPGDIIIIRELLKLSGARFKLTIAHSVSDSIDLLRTGNYDIILLDLGLPDSSGLETLREFVSLEFGPPVVVMTGLDDEDMALASLRYGAQDYLVKNRFGSENILKSIKYSIERKKLENLQKRNSHQLSILSETTAALYGGDDIPSIYHLICNSIRRLIAGTYVVSVEFIDPYSFHLSNTEQLEPWSDDIKELTGISLHKTVFRRSDQKMEILEMFKDGKLHFLEGGIFELLGESISAENAIRIENITGMRNMYLIGFLQNDIYYGGILIFSPVAIENDNISIIENLCSQASLGIYRRVIQRNLIASESRYQKLAGELEEKVRERTSELENANKQLRQSEAQLMELNATKDKFFNIVAHDLKNPFTSLLGATELLFNNIENMDRTKIRRLAQILNDSAKSGYSILLNLLDWSRSQTGTIKINLQKLSIGSIIEENIADVHLNSIDKEISITAEIIDDIQVIADKNMINTIVRNLISNAIKFTQRGGKVMISCRLKGKEVQVSVKDNGIGISKENIGKLFRIDSKFSRPGTDKETGTGLGLKLSREFVEKLGGRIWVESAENAGSEFIFTIPLRGPSV
jgi:signal transduction histidine kinase/response regulator of citrate/malate metabolism